MEDGQRQKMADQSLLGLIFLCSFLKGTSGDTFLNVFISDGESVRLSCVNASTGCTSTTWMYYREISSRVDILFIEGMKNNDIERHERLSLGSDCSLNIYKATTEDHGRYVCRQHLNTPRHTEDVVDMHVLHVSPSSSQTEIRPGRSFSLSCQLYVLDGSSCVNVLYYEGINLVWKNESAVDLQSDSRYQISFSPEHCNSSLTTTLLDEDDNTQWRCEITKGDKVQTSVRYTVTYSDNKTLSGFSLRVILLIIEMAVFTPPTVILLWIVCERRAALCRSFIRSLRVVLGCLLTVLMIILTRWDEILRGAPDQGRLSVVLFTLPSLVQVYSFLPGVLRQLFGLGREGTRAALSNAMGTPYPLRHAEKCPFCVKSLRTLRSKQPSSESRTPEVAEEKRFLKIVPAPAEPSEA
ncbi:diverse immunoglobulin domain-containing protein 2.1 [Pimephales promelas]|nr:diverse immunoglobulin domain-containing protein 2.1 [Pimephales promelas]